jgi:hypothetical protein
MDWWKRLFDIDRLIPTVGGFVAGIAWLGLAFQNTGENAVALGSVRVNLLQLGLSCACFALSTFLAVTYFRDDDPYEHLP